MNVSKNKVKGDQTKSIKDAHAVDTHTDAVIKPEHVLKDINEDAPMVKKTNTVIVLGYLLLVVLGVATGFILSGKSGQSLGILSAKPSVINNGKQAGSTDTATFKDSAVGVLQKGGLDGEGTHQLVRDGGPSQTAYLISSVVDLDQFVGKKVKVWGQTLAAKKAPWLLDVGKIEVQ
jgi:hypothetical protein